MGLSADLTCSACGVVFTGTTPPETIEAELAAFADMPEAPMAVVCDDCLKRLREHFPTLDARLKLEGL